MPGFKGHNPSVTVTKTAKLCVTHIQLTS